MGWMSPTIQWSADPQVITGVTILTLAYVWAWRRARRPGMPHPPGYGRLAVFASSMLVVLAALISPIDSMSDDLMVIHMVQHMLLLDVMPILLILSLTKGILRPVTRRLNRLEQRAGFFGHPAFAVILYVGMMWLWHVPAMYDLALRNPNSWHILEHICFAAAGTLYWWHLLSPIRTRMRLGGMGPVMYMVVTKFGVGVLGVMLAFAPHAIYGFYAHQPDYWGLTHVQDQNMAGLVMALEQSIVMGIAVVWLFIRMLSESEEQAQRAERYEDMALAGSGPETRQPRAA
jgi:cytochrome c oxidase assembly factor CtaG